MLPFSSLVVADYLVFVSKSRSAKSAVSTAVVALKWLYSFIPGINAINNPLNEEFLTRLTQSETRNHYKLKERKKPFSNAMIQMLLDRIKAKENPSLTELRNTLIPTLAYTLLLRHDEISHLNCNHISTLENGLKFFIPFSKTDTYREGKYVNLADDNSDLYALFFRYVKAAHLNFNQNRFFFAPIKFDKTLRKFALTNSKLSYDAYRNIVKQAVSDIGFDPNEFCTHSCRSGGANELASHVTEFELMVSGRWVDPRSIGSYVEISQERRLEISKSFQLNS